MSKKVFNFEETPVAKVSENIRNNNQEVAANQKPQEEKQEQQPVTSSLQGGMDVMALKPKKATKGVKVELPMDYYLKLTMIKEHTGKTLQELAAISVCEFVDRYRGE